MKFYYKKYGPGILRPVIRIEIIYKNLSVPYEVLIDSGADFCIFDAQIADILGINVESGEKNEVAGITGVNAPIYFHDVTIKVGGWPFKIRAAFLREIGRFGYGVVGQKGFFDLFRTKFIFSKGIIEITPEQR
ncbi:retropepsin-like domain-containing protein [Patescibacteria group bacterium]|nr:retropepsin-like domain-containing protein [Patescibacteria group bacterium]MBU4481589.1 retropepsin-like domain-containing protein [Patescibacteria group bacterium]